MVNILCYGDSNTWGYIPGSGGKRFERDSRWPGIMQYLLGPEYHVIEEGLNSRTTVFDDPVKGYKSGLNYLAPCLASHKPLDLVILMLGTNDLHERFGMSAYNVGEAMKRLVELILHSESGRNSEAPQVLLVSPVHITDNLMENFIGEEMGISCIEKSANLHGQIKRVAEIYDVRFLDAEEYVHADAADGLHMNAESHNKLACVLSAEISKIFDPVTAGRG